jgi:hypothetical protein
VDFWSNAPSELSADATEAMMAQDRAEVLVTALWQIAAQAIRDRLDGGSKAALLAARAHAVEYMHGELADIARQTHNDIWLTD